MFEGKSLMLSSPKLLKTIPRELCSQLSKPGIEQQGQCNPHTDPSPYNNFTVQPHSPHFSPLFTDRESGVQQVTELALGSKPKAP